MAVVYCLREIFSVPLRSPRRLQGAFPLPLPYQLLIDAYAQIGASKGAPGGVQIMNDHSNQPQLSLGEIVTKLPAVRAAKRVNVKPHAPEQIKPDSHRLV